MPKRNFTSGFDRFLENMISKLPNGNVGYVILFLNTFFYFLYLMWSKYSVSIFFLDRLPVLSNSLFAKAWFSLSILSFSIFLTPIFKDFGPTVWDARYFIVGTDDYNI